MYSQRDEEKVILELLEGKVGMLLDIGAYDGKTFSNTRALLESGWEGVMVEASPHSFVGLVENTRGLNAKLVLATVVPVRTTALELLFNSPDAVSTTDEDHRKKWEKVANYVPIWSSVVGVPELLASFTWGYDFISLDVEGLTIEILRALLKWLPTRGGLPEVMCIEVDCPETLDLCVKAGYKLVHTTAENIIVRRLK